MDSFSQAWDGITIRSKLTISLVLFKGIDDETEQFHWREETSKLWLEATSKNSTFDFKTIGKYNAKIPLQQQT